MLKRSRYKVCNKKIINKYIYIYFMVTFIVTFIVTFATVVIGDIVF